MTKPWEMDWSKAPTQEAVKPWEMGWKKPAPAKREYKGFEAPVAAAKNFFPSLQNFAGGVAQAVLHPVESLNVANDAINGAVLKMLPKQLHWLATYDVAAFKNRAPSDPQIKKMVETASAVGGVYKERYGDLKSAERTFAEDPVGFAADLSTVLSGAGWAAKAGNLTKTAKVLNTAADLTNPMVANTVVGTGLKKTGNALAKTKVPGTKPVANVLGATGNVVNWLGPKKPMDAMASGTAAGVAALRNAVAPRERAWARATTSEVNGVPVQEGEAVIDLARDKMSKGEVELVPGSKPTLAEVVSDLKLTNLAQFDQVAKKHLSTQAARRQMANEAAQLEHIGKVAKTDTDLKKAEALRSDESDPLYDQAKGQTAAGDAALVSLLGRPSMGRVMKRAQELAAEDGKPFQFGENTPAKHVPEQTVDSTILGPNGKPMQTTEPGYVIPPKFAQYKGEILHYIKLAFDDEIKDIKAKFQPGVESEELRKIYATREKFLNWVEQPSKIPEYREARATYQMYSKPIDRMLIGRYLEERLTPVHGEDAATLRSTTYENALKDAPRTARVSIGRKNIENLEEILLPEEMKIVNQVRDDLRRSKLNERLAKFGRGNDPDIKKMATDAVGDATPPSFFHPVATAAKALWEGLKGKLDERAAIRVATELIAEDLNVPIAAIEKALAHELKVKQTRRGVEKNLKAAGNATLRAPAVYNALSPEQEENRNALAR